MNDLHEILSTEQVHSVFQPIVDLDTDLVVGYEALARGPVGDLQRPDLLFAAAAAAGRLTELDELCQRAALRGAMHSGIHAPLTLFVNVEPEVVQPSRLEGLLAAAQHCPGNLRLMLEITERALAVRPADLLATVQQLRAAGWRIALDDVGANDLTLAFMPLLQPDVIKLDMALIQRRPGRKAAEIMNAVNAHAERTGALILAEGIENLDHLATARALGATLGQGWWFGRPADGPAPGRATGELGLPQRQCMPVQLSPFQGLPASVTLRHTTKALLIEVSKHLEREAKRLGGTCLIISTFQDAENFTPSTARRYQDLAEHVGFVGVIGADLDREPVPGVRGADLELDDPVRQEWDIAVLAPHFAGALIARDLNSTSVDNDRFFEFALTYDRRVVESATRSLMSRILPDPGAALDALPDAPARTVVTATGPAPETAVWQPVADDAIDDDAAGRGPTRRPVDRQRLLVLAEAPLLEARLNNPGAAVIYLRVDSPDPAENGLRQRLSTAALSALQRRIRRRDLMAEQNGDITIVLSDLDRSHAGREAWKIADQLATELAALIPRDNPDAVGFSFGVSSFPADGHAAGQLIAVAEGRSRLGLLHRT
jgi:EAL domain-containing protein (putative c-di-GMP-specific phosphodiesterase class I)/GGDEF domain-containing protein